MVEIYIGTRRKWGTKTSTNIHRIARKGVTRGGTISLHCCHAMADVGDGAGAAAALPQAIVVVEYVLAKVCVLMMRIRVKFLAKDK